MINTNETLFPVPASRKQLGRCILTNHHQPMKKIPLKNSLLTGLRLIATLPVVILIILLSGVTASRAANGPDTWVGTVSDNLGDANWVGANNPPLSGDELVFGGVGSFGTLLTNTLTAANSAAGLLFTNGASAYAISGNSITLTGGITNLSTSPEIITLPITSTASHTFITTNAGVNLTLGGVLTGTGGGITTAGAGILTVSGTNLWTGTNVVGPGTTLNITGTYFGPAAAGSTANMTIGNGAGNAIVNFSGSYLTNNNFDIGVVNGAVGALYQTFRILGRVAGSQRQRHANRQCRRGSSPDCRRGEPSSNLPRTGDGHWRVHPQPRATRLTWAHPANEQLRYPHFLPALPHTPQDIL